MIHRTAAALLPFLILATPAPTPAATPAPPPAPASAPATATAPLKDVEVAIAKVAFEPTRVTAKVEEAPPADLFFRLAQQAKVGIVASDDGVWDEPALQGARFTAEWAEQPLWEAVAEACLLW